MRKILSLVMAVLFTGSLLATDYQLVKSTSDLKVGSKYVIGNAKSGKGIFMSTENRANNRGIEADITITDGKMTATDKVLVLELGGKEGAWTFKTTNYLGTDGYLTSAATGKNNYCKVSATEEDCSKFTIVFNSADSAVITSTGRSERNILRYNKTNSVFACYTSGQDSIFLYKEVASGGGSGSTTTTIYCKMTQSWWTADGAAVGVHYWGGTSEGTTWPGVRMSPVSGEEGTWSYDVPSDITGIIFTRVNPSGAVTDWGAKTGDLTLPTDGNDLYTITSSTAVWGSPCAGEWSKYATGGGGGGGSTTAYYMKNCWNGATDWTWKAMEQDGANYKLSNVVFGGTGVNYNTAESDAGSTWVAIDAIAGDKIAALDTVDLVLDPVAKTVTATLLGKYDAGGGSGGGGSSEAKYYITGNSALVVDAGLTADKAWAANAIAVTEADAYKLNLKADVAYQLKVTKDGTWNDGQVVGYSALTGDKPAGVTADGDDNLCFSLSEAGEVIVTYNASTFTIAGKFNTSGGGGGSTDAYYMKNCWNGATDWTWKAMEQDGANYKLSNVVFGGTGVNYNTAESDEGSTWVPAEEILGAKIGALDTVDLVLDPVAKTVTATLIGKYEIPSDAKYYMKNNWNGATDWTWKEMTKDGATYKLENVVFGGTGVNFNTKEEDSGSTWVAVDAILGDKIAALDTVTLVLKPGDAEVTATLLGKYEGGSGGGGSTEAKYFITGDSALVVDAGLAADKAWNAAAIAVTEADAYKLNLKADVAYKLKVTKDGTWNDGQVVGYSALTGDKPAGVTADADDNICFTLAEAGEVTVTYNATTFTIAGNFDTSSGGGSTDADYYLKNCWNGGDWAWKGMTKDGDTYKLENVVFGGTGVNYNTAQDDAGATWVAIEEILGDKIGALDTVTFVFNPVAKTVTATLIGKYQVPADAKYYMKNNWNGATDWTWKEMTKDGANQKLENVVFGGTGVNYNTAESDAGSTWVAIDAILGDKIGALDTVTFVLDPAAGTVTATLLGKYEGGGSSTEAKYFITGDSALVVDAGLAADQAWNAAAIAVTEADAYKLNLKAGVAYKLKVTKDGTWNDGQVVGYSNLTDKPAGVTADADDNICFTLAEAGEVTVAYNAAAFTIAGKFAAPVAAKFYVVGGGDAFGNWNPSAIPVMDDIFTIKNLEPGLYKFRISLDGTWNNTKGFSDLTTVAEGLSEGDDNNIIFGLTVASDVTITYTGTIFTVEGNFATSQIAQYGLFIDGTTFVGAELNPDDNNELMIVDLALTAGQTFVLYDNASKAGWAAAIWKDDTSYKFNIENDAYVVSETAVYDFYLHIEANNDYLYVVKHEEMANENIYGVGSELRKVIENGVMYIYRDGKKYSVQGLLVE